jgi:hypothetical protein
LGAGGDPRKLGSPSLLDLLRERFQFTGTRQTESGRRKVHIISLEAGDIKGRDKKDWGRPVKVDKTLSQVSAAEYGAVVLPDFQINPDQGALLDHGHRQPGEDRRFCHASWLVIETGVAKGRKMTSYKSFRRMS